MAAGSRTHHPLLAVAGEVPRGYQPTPLPRRWPNKSSLDVLDYTLDCGDGDAIASASVAVEPVDLQVIVRARQGGKLIVWLSGGAAGDHIVTWSIAFASGRQIVADVAIAVASAPAVAVPSPPILATRPSEATPLLARDGTPLLPDIGTLANLPGLVVF